MPDFSARLTAGVVLEAWQDADSPQRTNPIEGRPHKRWRATLNSPVTAKCTVAGVEGPLDSNPVMAGFVFRWWWVEIPGGPQPFISIGAGQSSVVQFTPTTAGHHVLGVRWEEGASAGPAVLIHLDARPPAI